MASAFSNNTERLNSSDRTSNFKAKTNYNYLRLVSLKNVDNQSNYVGCKNKIFSSSSGNVILGYNPNPQDTPPKRSSHPSEATLSKLVSTRSYDLRSSINKGFYLPTTIPKNDTTNNNINRPPYTYDPTCNEFFDVDDETQYTRPNTSGDLQDILFNEYLDFGNLTLITNTQFVNENSFNNNNTSQEGKDSINDNRPFKTMNPNQIQITDASFGDYILDPENIINNYKDSNLSTYLELEKAETSYTDTDDGKKKILKVINWKKLQINSFPNNKYHRFSVNEPIKFYNYASCHDENPPSKIPFGQDSNINILNWDGRDIDGENDDIISST